MKPSNRVMKMAEKLEELQDKGVKLNRRQRRILAAAQAKVEQD